MCEMETDVKGIYICNGKLQEVILYISKEATSYKLRVRGEAFDKEFLFEDSFDLYDYIHKNFILYI